MKKREREEKYIYNRLLLYIYKNLGSFIEEL